MNRTMQLLDVPHDWAKQKALKKKPVILSVVTILAFCVTMWC